VDTTVEWYWSLKVAEPKSITLMSWLTGTRV